MEWYMQPGIQGLVVMAVFAAIKAIAYWAKRPLSDTAAAKVLKLVTVAAATAAATIVTTGLTAAFWPAWAVALATAIGSWEVIAKGYGLTQPPPEPPCADAAPDK
jgi:hypothetical protein